jgi:acetyltransferase EpsM
MVPSLSEQREQPVAVIGAGGHGLVVISLLIELGYQVLGVFDDDETRYGKSCLGIPVLGKPEDIRSYDCHSAITAIGENQVRQRMYRRLPELEWLTLVHPRAFVHPSVEVGSGTIVMLDAVVWVGASIGCHSIINTKAVVGHGCTLGNYTHIAGSVHMGGDSVVEEGAMIGMNAVIIPQRRVGAWSVVGAGGVVIRDVPPHARAVGVPAVVK